MALTSLGILPPSEDARVYPIFRGTVNAKIGPRGTGFEGISGVGVHADPQAILLVVREQTAYL